MEIYKSKFVSLFFDEAQKLFISKWSVDSVDITEEEIKHEFSNAVDLVLQYKPKFFLSDNRNQKFIFSIDIQNWIAITIITPCVNVGTEKFAILNPEELIPELSIEQAADEVSNLPIEIKQFEKESEALEWLGLI